ncbi:MAG: DUF3343 domain-containing protein [Thermodesulfobacteriota bacterium]
MEYLLAFGSTHRVLKAEKILKEKGVAFRLNPSPPSLAAYCDLVITVSGDTLPDAKAALTVAKIKPKAVYKAEGGAYVKV